MFKLQQSSTDKPLSPWLASSRESENFVYVLRYEATRNISDSVTSWD